MPAAQSMRCDDSAESARPYYTWKAKDAGLEASDVKRLKELEHENSRLQQMYANLSMDHVRYKVTLQKI